MDPNLIASLTGQTVEMKDSSRPPRTAKYRQRAPKGDPEEFKHTRAIRLKDSHWEEFLRRGGIDWLRSELDRSKER